MYSGDEKKLVVIPSNTFAIYLIAYIKEYGSESKFDVFFDRDRNLPDYLLQEFQSLDCTIATRESLLENSYSELVIHSFASFENQLEILESVRYEKLTLYSDGFSLVLENNLGFDINIDYITVDDVDIYQYPYGLNSRGFYKLSNNIVYSGNYINAGADNNVSIANGDEGGLLVSLGKFNENDDKCH
jgi:hypothetical protein